MKDCKAKILGTTYKIRFRHENEDENYKNCLVIAIIQIKQ